MPKYCCAPYCFNNNKKHKEKHFHLFPKEESRRNEWKNSLNLTESPTKHKVVCSDHFVDSDYVVLDHSQGNAELLRKTSVPKIVIEEYALTADELVEIYFNCEVEPGSEEEILDIPDQSDDKLNNWSLPTDPPNTLAESHAVDLDVQLPPEVKPIRVHVEPEVAEVGVQASPEVKPVYVQATPEMKNFAVQAELPRKRSSFSSLSDNDLIYFTGLERERFDILHKMLERFNPIDDNLLWSKKDALVITLFKCKHNLDFKIHKN